ncbi:thioesterase domain-containing protein [uncultured Paludibaculum sp.]|uniref:thioesterase domain-containing protein n=1 Tax=uncultured Paludibaculum sp. TaxID=1765020 RepID=UPI002AAC1C16|nr:thioesterase domain-containing protein [uncultured Paludibaculum sp.]
MKVLLAHNSTYFPSLGGGDKSNRLLMEALAQRGHAVRVVTRVEQFGPQGHEAMLAALRSRGVEGDGSDGICIRFELAGVSVRVLSLSPHLRGFFQTQIDEFQPDIIITSTDDPGQLLFDIAVKAPNARVVYLVRATIAVPFGPDSSMVSASKTEVLKRADATVGVSHYVAGYVREWSGIDAIHVPISLMEPVNEFPLLGRFDNPYVAMVNPCAVKGISIFLELADRMPDVPFAAIPTWGTQADELESMRQRPNITLLDQMDNIDGLLKQTKVMLVPSVWAEARSRIVLEAMSRGIPVVASDVGGLHEAKLGVPYLIRVNPIVKYRPSVDASMVPVAEVPPQDVDPWHKVVRRLTADEAHWNELAAASRKAALEYTANLNVLPFESVLEGLIGKPKRQPPAPKLRPILSDDKKKLLTLRLKQHTSAAKPDSNTWLPGIEEVPAGKLKLFCFPWAGGGALPYRAWRDKLVALAGVVPVRLPGRETRAAEPPFVRMGPLVEAILQELRPFLGSPFSFFGHSMGAGISFELARALRREGLPMPMSLHVSGARAPQYRLNHVPPPEPSMRDFIEELRRLEGFPPSVLNNPELLKLALPSLLSDARLYRHYTYAEEAPLNIPLFAYGGEADPNVTADHLAAWGAQTTKMFRHSEFKGGHFFLEPAQAALLSTLKADLTLALQAR